MRSLLIVVFVVLFSSVSLTASEDWGKTGHRTMGEIAAKHLSKRAAKKISALLGGESLAFVSTYADEIRSDDAYRKYGPWHYVNFPFGGRYENTPKNKKGDIIVGIQNCIDVLKDATSSQKDKEFYLRLLVHFIGDLHMPLHVGLKEDKGGKGRRPQSIVDTCVKWLLLLRFCYACFCWHLTAHTKGSAGLGVVDSVLSRHCETSEHVTRGGLCYALSNS